MTPPTNLTHPLSPTAGTEPPRYYEEIVRHEMPEPPNIEHLVIEDDEPVDNLYCETQMRLLPESLNSSWHPGRDFLVMANVGLFLAVNVPPIVPDVMLSMDVKQRDDLTKKENLSYFIWDRGKRPDLAIEIVSQRPGGEDKEKLVKYAQFGIPYYVIWDPMRRLKGDRLRLYELRGDRMHLCSLSEPKETIDPIEGIKLGLTLWQGVYEGKTDTWLRWTDAGGKILPTGKELADAAISNADEQSRRAHEQSRRALEQTRRADEQRQRADKEAARAERFAELLRQQGIDPDTV